MLTCIARPKKPGSDSLSQPDDSDSKNQAIKSLTSQLKDMALKASGAYKHCSPCTGPPTQTRIRSNIESDSDSDRFRWSYRRTGSSSSTTTRTWGKEMEARLKGISSGEGTPNSSSGRRVDPVVLFVEENEPKEWVAQVEPGVLITFVSLPRGGNDLKRIRFRYVTPPPILVLSFAVWNRAGMNRREWSFIAMSLWSDQTATVPCVYSNVGQDGTLKHLRS